jgi:hypothetical protein
MTHLIPLHIMRWLAKYPGSIAESTERHDGSANEIILYRA